jgi:hypothetical protein
MPRKLRGALPLSEMEILYIRRRNLTKIFVNLLLVMDNLTTVLEPMTC